MHRLSRSPKLENYFILLVYQQRLSQGCSGQTARERTEVHAIAWLWVDAGECLLEKVVDLLDFCLSSSMHVQASSITSQVPRNAAPKIP
jgi:hypothetical protein